MITFSASSPLVFMACFTVIFITSSLSSPQIFFSTSVLESVEKEIWGDLSDYVMNITVKHAMKTRGEEAEKVVMKELSQMVDKCVWRPVHVHRLSAQDRGRIIRSQIFLKEKYLPTGQSTN